MRKKTLIIGIILLTMFLLLQFNTTGWITRSISNSQDNKETLICNSNGKCWEPTGSNIQLAIDDLESGIVWLPAGTFIVSAERIWLRDNVYLRGKGIGNTIIKKADGTAGYPLYAESIENFTISDLTVDGNWRSGCRGNGIVIREGCKNFIIRNIHVKGANSSALRIANSRNGFVSNYMSSDTNVYHGLDIETVQDSVFSDCLIIGNENPVDYFAVDVSAAENCTFNNIIVKNARYGMKVEHNEQGDKTLNCNFNNMVFINMGEEEAIKLQYQDTCNYNNFFISGGKVAVGIRSQSSNLNLNNFHIQNPDTIGLLVEGPDAKKINIANTAITNSGTYGISINSAEDVTISNTIVKNAGSENRVQGSSKISISDSQFKNGNYFGWIIANSQDVTIKNCKLTDNNVDGLLVDGSSGEVTDFIISDNVITGNSNDGIEISNHAHDNFIITNNILVGNAAQAIRDSTGAVNKIVGDNLT